MSNNETLFKVLYIIFFIGGIGLIIYGFIQKELIILFSGFLTFGIDNLIYIFYADSKENIKVLTSLEQILKGSSNNRIVSYETKHEPVKEYKENKIEVSNIHHETHNDNYHTSANTKYCKHCRSMIDKKAKICPICHKGQSSILVKIIIFIFILSAVILGLVYSCAKTASDAITETTNEYYDIHNRTSFKINETFESKHLKITMTQVEKDFKDYTDLLGPKEGNKIIMAKFDAENIGTNDQYVSSYDFKGYVDDVAVSSYVWAESKYPSLSATLSAGKKGTGYVFMEVPKDATTLTLEYEASWLNDQKIKFIIE